MRARISDYDREKGFGFGVPLDGTDDVFIHRRNLPQGRRFANRGDEVEYELGTFNGRAVAVNIKFVHLAPPQPLKTGR